MTTRDQIIRLADKLIRTKGYNSFSYKDISTQLDIKNAAIHYYFPSKSDLGAAVIKNIKGGFIKAKREWSELDARTQLNNFIRTYEEKYYNHELCIVGALGPSFDTIPANMQVEIKDLIVSLRSWLITLLEKGLTEKSFHFTETPTEKAGIILSLLMTSLFLTKILDNQYFETILDQVKNGV